MRTEADTVLEQARQEILNAAGQGILLNEFTGSQGYDVDLKFTPWDMDSDYDDVNVCATVETLLKEKMPEKGQDVKVSVVKVESWPASGNGEEAVEDYSVIAQDGAINYEKVTYDMLDSEVGGAVYDVTLKLTYLQSSLEEEATFIVPMHTYTRQERLDDAAEYAVRFSTIQGNNSAPEQITGDLTLPNLADDDTYAYYAIFSAWESSQPEVVAVDGKVNHGDQDVPVTLKVKTYYSQAWLDDSDYMMDPGPLGENESVDEIQVTVLSADNALQTTVQKAQTLYNQAKEGTGYGQYAPGAKAKLNHAIKEAKAVLADDNADNAAKQAAMAKLELAIASFEDERRPVAANVSIVIHADNGFLYPRTEIVAPSDADADVYKRQQQTEQQDQQPQEGAVNARVQEIENTLMEQIGEMPAFNGGENLGALVISLTNPYWVGMKEAYEAAAEEYGVNIEVMSAPTEGDKQSQLETLQGMALKDYDAIVLSPIEPYNLLPGIVSCNENEIPVINLGPVSYTHLDVYKRQLLRRLAFWESR